MSVIYLIEDDNFQRELLRLDLEDAGHKVVGYNCGNDALADLVKNPPDILVTDIVMRDGEGIGTIMAARKLYPKMRVIAISAHRDYLKFASDLGASETVEKPFRTREFSKYI